MGNVCAAREDLVTDDLTPRHEQKKSSNSTTSTWGGCMAMENQEAYDDKSLESPRMTLREVEDIERRRSSRTNLEKVTL